MANVLKPLIIEAAGGIPEEPDWSQTYSDVLDITSAHEEWGIVVQEMQRAQILTVANGHAIARLVHFRMLYRTALQQVAEKGAVLKRTRKNDKFNPHWSVMCRASDGCLVLEGELGISPVRRARATRTQKRVHTARAADTYLKNAA